MLRLPRKAVGGLAQVMQAVEESLALPTLELAKGFARLQGAGSTPYSWLATKMKRAFGTIAAMVGGTTL